MLNLPQKKEPFPANRDEALKFSNDILQILTDKNVHDNIMHQLSSLDGSNPVEKEHGVGMIAGNIVGDRVADVRSQTGRTVEMRLVVDGIKAVIKELGDLSKKAGFFNMTEKDNKMALKVAVDILDKMSQSQQGQQQAQGGMV